MHPGSAPIVFLLALVALPQAAQQVREDQIPELLNEQLRAVELYRDGRLGEAFQILDRHGPSLNERLAALVASSLKKRLRLQVDDVSQQPRNWTPELVHSLAALHMEAALRVYEQRGRGYWR